MTQTMALGELNHMSFPSNDVAGTTRFFEKYLGFSVLMNEAPKFTVLKRPGLDVVIEGAGKDSATTTALTAAGTDTGAFRDCVGKHDEDLKWPISFHIGLELPTLEDVHALRDKLAGDGFTAETDIFNNNRGSRFFLRAPGGILCEFNTRADGGDENFRAKYSK